MEPISEPRSTIMFVDDKKPPISFNGKNKKRRGAMMSLLRAALLMWRKGSNPGVKSNPTLPVEVSTASIDMLSKVVGSMRPLHVHGSESPVHLLPAPTSSDTPVLIHESPARNDLFEDVHSPTHSSFASDDISTSPFASALNLQDLDKNDDEESDDDDDCKFEAINEDEMIDTKADEFIAQFYQQMRLQNDNEKLRRLGFHRG